MVLSMNRWVGKVAVVTGASSGIGAAIAEQLVKEGLKVVGLARRKNRIDDLAKKLSGAKGKLFSVQTDLRKEQDILNAFKWVKDNLGPVHILVNNAAFLNTGTLIDGSTEIWRNTVDINVLALSIATREAIKDMRANNVDGHIIHINSVGGQVVPNGKFDIYPATKFAVRALAETLRLELNSLKSKIKITVDLSRMLLYKLRVWRSRAERYSTNHVTYHQGGGGSSITGWGVISRDRPKQLVVLGNVTMNGEKHLNEVLQPVVLKFANGTVNEYDNVIQ